MLETSANKTEQQRGRNYYLNLVFDFWTFDSKIYPNGKKMVHHKSSWNIQETTHRLQLLYSYINLSCMEWIYEAKCAEHTLLLLVNF